MEVELGKLRHPGPCCFLPALGADPSTEDSHLRSIFLSTAGGSTS